MHSLSSSRQDTQLGLIMATLNVLVKLLPSSPFCLSTGFFIGVHRFLSACCFYFHFLNFLGCARGKYLVFQPSFIGCHVFDIRSCHVYFQGQYSLYVFPFVCSIFLVIFFALVVFVFNTFLVFIFLHPLPGFQFYKGV